MKQISYLKLKNQNWESQQTIHSRIKAHPTNTLPQQSDQWVEYPGKQQKEKAR